MRISSVVLSSADPRALAAFYEQLLGWAVVESYPPEPGMPEADGWVVVKSPESPVKLCFQYEPCYETPAWPAVEGRQQMMSHLDIGSEDLAAAVEWAVTCGATQAGHQPQDDVRVMLDPAGHPFCLFQRAL